MIGGGAVRRRIVRVVTFRVCSQHESQRTNERARASRQASLAVRWLGGLVSPEECNL